MKRKPNLEVLEDRRLMTAGLKPLMVPTAALVNAAATKQTVVSSPLTIVLIPGATHVPPVRSYDWVSGIRLNHNETLVRDAGRRAAVGGRRG